MNFWTQVDVWFSAERRQAIYSSIAGLAPALIAIGLLSDPEVESVLVIVAAALQAAAGVLAILHLTPMQVGRWFQTVGRGIIYSLAATVAPAAVALGLLTDAGSVNVLTGVSVGLTVIASVLGVVMVSRQKTESVAQTVA